MSDEREEGDQPEPGETRRGLPVLAFSSPTAWRVWLETRHASSKGLWLKIAKKGSGIETVTCAEALDVALCYGWIDGQKGAADDRWWLQRFTPRGPRSRWSKTNPMRCGLASEGGGLDERRPGVSQRIPQTGMRSLTMSRQRRLPREQSLVGGWTWDHGPVDEQARLDQEPEPSRALCALCARFPASRQGEHIRTRWLHRHLFPAADQPYTTFVNDAPVMKRDGRTPRRDDHLPPRLLPICDQSTGGRCNQTLSARFEQPATRAAVKSVLGAEVLDTGEAGRAVEWWLKTALLSVHPRAYDPGDIEKPVWDGDVDPDLYTWMIEGLAPPSKVSLWVALPTSSAYGDAQALPRSSNDVIDLPTWTLAGRDRVSRISVFGLASLQFHLLYHPGWEVAHPFEASRQAIRLWPWAGGALDLSAVPRLDGPGLREWLDLWGTPVRLMLEPGYDPRDHPWVLAPGWAGDFPFTMAGVIGAML